MSSRNVSNIFCRRSKATAAYVATTGRSRVASSRSLQFALENVLRMKVVNRVRWAFLYGHVNNSLGLFLSKKELVLVSEMKRGSTSRRNREAMVEDTSAKQGNCLAASSSQSRPMHNRPHDLFTDASSLLRSHRTIVVKLFTQPCSGAFLHLGSFPSGFLMKGGDYLRSFEIERNAYVELSFRIIDSLTELSRHRV